MTRGLTKKTEPRFGSIDTTPFSELLCRVLDTIFVFQHFALTLIHCLLMLIFLHLLIPLTSPRLTHLSNPTIQQSHTQDTRTRPKRTLQLPTMAEAFLRELLQVRNSIQPTSGDQCVICFAECGTLCNETGIVEVEIRLPCNHIVGSRCIATWLGPTGAANNSCPLCRRVFFPEQPQPYLEHGSIEDGGNGGVHNALDLYNDYDVTPDLYWHPDLTNYRPWASGNMLEVEDNRDGPLERFENRVENVAGPTNDLNFHGIDWGEAQYGNEEVAAAAEEGNSEDIIPEPPVQATVLRRSARLRGIAPESLVQADTPRRSARQQSDEQNDEQQIQEERTEELRRSARLRGIAPEPLVQADIPRRSARQQSNEQNDEQWIQEERVKEQEEEREQDQDEEQEQEVVLNYVGHPTVTNLETVTNMCQTYCDRLNLTADPRVVEISRKFAAKVYVAALLAGHTPASIAAVSVFAASHLTGVPKTLPLVSLMSGVDADVISGLYFYVYVAQVRVELIDAEMLAVIDRGDVDTVLGFLPPA